MKRLHDLAGRNRQRPATNTKYGDNKTIWFDEGKKILDYLEAHDRFNAASFMESLEEQGVAINENDIAILIDNMRSLAKQWRSSIGERGELVFYVDSC